MSHKHLIPIAWTWSVQGFSRWQCGASYFSHESGTRHPIDVTCPECLVTIKMLLKMDPKTIKQQTAREALERFQAENDHGT